MLCRRAHGSLPHFLHVLLPWQLPCPDFALLYPSILSLMVLPNFILTCYRLVGLFIKPIIATFIHTLSPYTSFVRRKRSCSKKPEQLAGAFSVELLGGEDGRGAGPMVKSSMILSWGSASAYLLGLTCSGELTRAIL